MTMIGNLLEAYRGFRRFVSRQTGARCVFESLAAQKQLLEQQTRILEQQGAALNRLTTRLDELDQINKLHDLRLAATLSPYRAAPLPVYLDHEFRPQAKLETGTSPHRVVVCSIPKAGTYLVGELLRLLGVVPTSLHLSGDGLSDYRFASIQEMRASYKRFTARIPLVHSAALVRPGQFAVGHIECTPTTVNELDAFKKIFVHRNLRDALVSFMRFLVDTGRTNGANENWKQLPDGPDRMGAFLDVLGSEFLAMCHLGWLAQPSVERIAFETLYGDLGETAQRAAIRSIHSFLEIPGDFPDPEGIVKDLIGRPTKTWSGGRSRRELYWNQTIEEQFAALGGRELNHILGYDEPWEALHTSPRDAA